MTKEFTIKVKMEDRWVNHFISFLKRMEVNGNIGHSELISFYSDGDGDFHPEFEFEGIEYEKVEPCVCNNDGLEVNPILVKEYYDAG